jgi:hypothetical protein
VPRKKAPPEVPLGQRLAERLEAISRALASERDSCTSIKDARFPINVPEIRAMCARLGSQFDVELYARPHEVGISSKKTRYHVNVGCRARCYCRDGQNSCYLAETAYLGMIGEKLKPVVSAETVKADVDLVMFKDEARGIFSPAAKQCFLRRPPREVLARAIADPAARRDEQNRVLVDAGGYSLIGETSGAIIPMSCEFHCTDDKNCRASTNPVGFDTTNYSDVAQKLKPAPQELLAAARSGYLGRDSATMYLATAAESHPAKGTGSPISSTGSRCEYPFAFNHFFALSGDLSLSQSNIEDERENPDALNRWSKTIGAENEGHLGFPSFGMFDDIERDLRTFFQWYDKLPSDVLALCQKPDRSWPTLRHDCGRSGSVERCISALIKAQPILDGIERSGQSCFQVCTDHSVPALAGNKLPSSTTTSKSAESRKPDESGSATSGAAATAGSSFECTVGENGCTCFSLGKGRTRKPGTVAACPSYPCCELDIRNSGTPCNCWTTACGGTESEVNVPACPDPRYWEKVRCADRNSPDDFCAAQSAGPCDRGADHCGEP